MSLKILMPKCTIIRLWRDQFLEGSLKRIYERICFTIHINKTCMEQMIKDESYTDDYYKKHYRIMKGS